MWWYLREENNQLSSREIRFLKKEVKFKQQRACRVSDLLGRQGSACPNEAHQGSTKCISTRVCLWHLEPSPSVGRVVCIFLLCNRHSSKLWRVEKLSQKLCLQSILLETPSHWRGCYCSLSCHYQDFLSMSFSSLAGSLFPLLRLIYFQGKKGNSDFFRISDPFLSLE